MYDTRIGRWFSKDPIERAFPETSTYTYSRNTPIFYIDSDGTVVTPILKNKKDVFNSVYKALDYDYGVYKIIGFPTRN